MSPQPSPADHTAELLVPADSRYFAGHFPGAAILPGAALLQQALATIARHGGDTTAQALPVARAIQLDRVRFTKPVLPGARLAVRWRSLATALDVSAHDGEGMVLQATLAPSTEPGGLVAHAPLTKAGAAAAPCAHLLPHRGPAVLLRATLAHDEAELSATFVVGTAGPYATHLFPGCALFEAAAQATAAHAALRASAGESHATAPPAPGMLVGLKRAHARCAFPLDRELTTSVQRVGGNGPLAIYAARVVDADELLMRAELSVWTPAGGRGA